MFNESERMLLSSGLSTRCYSGSDFCLEMCTYKLPFKFHFYSIEELYLCVCAHGNKMHQMCLFIMYAVYHCTFIYYGKYGNAKTDVKAYCYEALILTIFNIAGC